MKRLLIPTLIASGGFLLRAQTNQSGGGQPENTQAVAVHYETNEAATRATAEADEAATRAVVQAKEAVARASAEAKEAVERAALREQRLAQHQRRLAQLDDARREDDQALKQLNEVMLLADTGKGGRRGGSKTVVIATTRTNTEALANLNEDMNIMGRVLDKSLADDIRPPGDKMMGIEITVFDGPRDPQNLYIEGQGALFIRRAGIALLPGAPKNQPAAPAKKDTAWDEAKHDLYGPRNFNKVKLLFDRRQDLAPYDAEKVEGLKRDILRALKDGANIRGLGQGESITVVILGFQETGPRGGPRQVLADPSGDVFLTQPPPAVKPVNLVVKITKADAEAALNGSVPLDELAKRASISIY